jgi:hypothetical protein
MRTRAMLMIDWVCPLPSCLFFLFLLRGYSRADLSPFCLLPLRLAVQARNLRPRSFPILSLFRPSSFPVSLLIPTPCHLAFPSLAPYPYLPTFHRRPLDRLSVFQRSSLRPEFLLPLLPHPRCCIDHLISMNLFLPHWRTHPFCKRF